ncbi:MAG: glycoside hydrolase family 2, partial [Bifidobacterium sp.]|nr:glycoside hydrolase family 2 [Bifidobacterium sp.]
MALQRIYDRPHPFRRYVPVAFALFWVEMRAIFQLVLAGCRKTVLQTAVRIVKKRKPFSTIKRRDVQGCRKGLSMLDIKRVLKAAPTKMRSREPLQQLWTPWGERIDHEWLS